MTDYLRGYQNRDGSFQSVYAAWLVLSALAALGESVDKDTSGYAVSLYRKHRIHETGYIETQSLFEPTYYLADVLHMLDCKQECGALGEKIAPYIKEDGSIGATDPGLASTYYGLAILQRAGIPCNDAEKTAGWACKYALPGGGFTKKPVTGLAFMDETYYRPADFQAAGRTSSVRRRDDTFRRPLPERERRLPQGAGVRHLDGFETSYFALESLRALLNIKY